ncbi:DNA primase [Jeotgalibacillus haloalkalitolerans]|uniref:DNA primase n=1 Tax=Jeotgalibacillus haloalkalitolerans TaxID=3104292 RepID=A0ABU5KLQ7_9BACL|nr:DNA primase [Jeotgalibacillus sp. HH7-29]MDZ5712197.1 DNA primase [Jeotgalibacillus sp. HH7-29]
MPERIPEEVVDQIRLNTDIVDVISEYVQLKKQGRNYFGLCPFHGENSPSFSVSPEKQIFHCFGCGAGGNVFTFLMDHNGMSFQESVASLGEKSDVQFEFSSPEEIEPGHVNLNEKAQLEGISLLEKLFHHLLMNTEEGHEALEYLLDRGFNESQLNQYHIGWALPGWETASKLLEKKGFDLSLMEEAGLLIKRDDGSYFDRFRNRIMFPIEDAKGRTVGFSGRIIKPEKNEPKYLNSPESPLFQKNTLLFNFHRARGPIRKEKYAVLFEGFADVIAASETVSNAVATMGTSLTKQHIQQIKRLTDTVVICYDGDNAGTEAAFKASRELASSGITVKVARLPNGMDPDDYIQKFGSGQFKSEIIQHASSLMAFKMWYLRTGKNLQTEDGRLSYINAVLPEISSLSSAVEKELYLKQLSDDTGVSFSSLEEQLKTYLPVQEDIQVRNEPIAPPPKKTSILKAYQRAERYLLAYMMTGNETAYTVQDMMEGLSFPSDDYQAIYTYLLAYVEEGGALEPGAFIEYLPDRHLRSQATELKMLELNAEVTKAELADYINELNKYRQVNVIRQKEAELKQAEQINDIKTATALGMEIFQLWKALKGQHR